MEIIFFVICSAAGLFVADRLGVWAERRGWIYWRKKGGGGGAAGLLGQVDSVLSPSTRTMVEERESKRMIRVDIANKADLDLETRTVRLHPDTGPGEVDPGNGRGPAVRSEP